MNNTNWTKEELVAYILLYTAHSNFEEANTEKNVIISKVDMQTFQKIHDEFEALVDVIVDTQSMEEAVKSAYAVGRKGDAVLLSPACASFDMFRDYPHRAQVFCQAVAEIAEAAGQVMEAAL